jgi:hypothetical protein
MKRSPTYTPRAALLVVFALAISALGGNCDDEVVKDPTFRDWCGGTLCSWTVAGGDIERVPTWNADDFGVSFVTTGAEISQVTQENAAQCLLFTTVADIDPAAQMTLILDFNNDGTPDFQTPLGATRWHQVQVEITAPLAYNGITFALRKEGTGTAVLAEINVVSTTGCTAPPVAAYPLLLGEPCSALAQCGRGLICTEGGICGECDNSTACADGAACQSIAFSSFQCHPGEHLGQPGDPCIVGADCASNECDGAAIGPTGKETSPDCPGSAPYCTLGPLPEDPLTTCECLVSHGGTCQ